MTDDAPWPRGPKPGEAAPQAAPAPGSDTVSDDFAGRPDLAPASAVSVALRMPRMPAPRAFNVTPLQPCPYLPDRAERKVWTELNRDDVPDYGILSRAGFRRSHRIAYRPACPGCTACVPVRIDVAGFRRTRGLRRILAANADLRADERPAEASAEQYALFGRYLDARHGDGEMAGMSFLEFRWMIEDSPGASGMLEFRRSAAAGGTIGKLTAACLIDRLDDGYSAVYSFFDPREAKRSLGSYVILWLVERAEEIGLPYVYLGYWIAGSPKMDYKRRFAPLEGLIGGAWRPLDDV